MYTENYRFISKENKYVSNELQLIENKNIYEFIRSIVGVLLWLVKGSCVCRERLTLTHVRIARTKIYLVCNLWYMLKNRLSDSFVITHCTNIYICFILLFCYIAHCHTCECCYELKKKKVFSCYNNQQSKFRFQLLVKEKSVWFIAFHYYNCKLG